MCVCSDNQDVGLEAAKEKGIYVCNNRAVNAVPVAELAVGHMITSLGFIVNTFLKFFLFSSSEFLLAYDKR